MKTLILMALALTPLSLLPRPGLAGDAVSGLAPFDRLVGGRWRLGDTVQAFEWDMDRHQVTARSYTVADGAERLVSVGAWYYHPGKDSIVGYFVARDMGIGLFEYSTRFDGDVMISQVVAWDDGGGQRGYEERWRFTGPDRYVWTLHESGEDGRRKLMEGVFERVE